MFEYADQNSLLSLAKRSGLSLPVTIKPLFEPCFSCHISKLLISSNTTAPDPRPKVTFPEVHVHAACFMCTVCCLWYCLFRFFAFLYSNVTF